MFVPFAVIANDAPPAVAMLAPEESSGDRRRLGHISKQGNALLRFRLVEAAQVTVRSDAEWGDKFFPLAMRRGRKIAKVAMARKLAVRLSWMMRKEWDYGQLTKFGSRGKARTSRWCEVKHRAMEWVSRSPRRGAKSYTSAAQTAPPPASTF